MRDPLSQGTGCKQGEGYGLALAALCLGWLVIAWPWISAAVTVPWDAKAQFLPQLQFLAQSFAKGESPFWTPYVFAGHPQIADPQSLIFSPPFLLMALLNPAPTAWAQDMTLYLLVLVSAAALMLWIRDRGWHPAGALIAALSYAFGAAMAWRIQHVGQVMSLAYLPIVLLCLDRALDRRSLVYGAGAGAVAGLMVLGRDQIALLAVYFLIAHVISHWWQAKDRLRDIKGSIAPLGLATLAGALVIAVPVVLTLLIAGDSNRPSIDLEGAGRGSLHPALFLTLLAPDVFGSSEIVREYWGPPSMRWNTTGLYIAQNVGQMYFGAVPFFLLLWGGLAGLYRARGVRLIAGALAAVTIYGLGKYTPAFQVFHAIVPGVDLYRRPADAVFLMGFFASILAGYSLHCVLTGSAPALARWQRLVLVAVPAVAFPVMIGLALHFGMLGDAKGHIAMAAVLVTGGAALFSFTLRQGQRQPILAAVLLIVFTIGDLAYSNGPGGATALPPSTYEVLDPKTKNDTIALLKTKTAETASSTRRDRVEMVGFGFHWPNASLTHSLDHTLGYNPLRLGGYTRATGAGDTVGLPGQKGFSALMPSYRSTLADLLGLRFIATSIPVEDIDKNLKPGDLTLLAQTTDGYIYENPHALPRVLFASKAHSADFDAMLKDGKWPETDIQTTVLLEGTSDDKARASGRVAITSYHNTSVSIEAESPDGGWVVLNDVWQPWWFATVDGVEAPLLCANVIFRAVEVPSGRHTVAFTFQPIRGALQQLKTLWSG